MDRMPQSLEVEEQSWRQELDEEEDNVVLVPCEDQMFGQVVSMEDGGRVLQSQDEEADSRDVSPVVSEPTDPAEQVKLDGNHYRAQGDADHANAGRSTLCDFCVLASRSGRHLYLFMYTPSSHVLAMGS